jgi:hypothetical protein
MIRILTVKPELLSANRFGFNVSTNLHDKPIESYDKDVVIRWGNSYKILNRNGDYRDFKMVLNPAKSIRNNCDKYGSLVKLSAVVKTPQIFKDKVPSGKTAVVRPFVHECAGKDFKIQKGPFNIPQGYYATEYLETDREYRVWFCNGKTLVVKRVPPTEDLRGQKNPCRSLWGYFFVEPSLVPQVLRDDTLKAAKALELDFGAADVLRLPNYDYRFLELNTAPSMDSRTAREFFITNFKKLIKERFNLDF